MLKIAKVLKIKMGAYCICMLKIKMGAYCICMLKIKIKTKSLILSQGQSKAFLIFLMEEITPLS